MSGWTPLSELGKTLMAVGVVLFLAGLFFIAGGRVSGLGRLPGDIYVRRGSFTFYFPFTTGLVVSLLLSLLFRLFGRG